MAHINDENIALFDCTAAARALSRVTGCMVPPKTVFLLIVSLAIAGLLLSSCSDLSQEESRQVSEAVNDSLLSTTESWEVDMEIIEEGIKKVRLTGSYAATFNTSERKETRISGPVHIQVFDSAGAVTTRVESERAIYRAESSEFELFGDVRIRTSDERRLESEYLKWNQASNRISSPKFVIITTPRDSIAGTGFNGTTNLNSFTIDNITGRVIYD